MLILFVIKYLNDHLEEMICNLRRGKIFNSISVIAICFFLICGSYYGHADEKLDCVMPVML